MGKSAWKKGEEEVEGGNGSGLVKRVPGGLFEVPLGRLSFRYAPVSLPYTTVKQPQLASHNGVFYEPARDPKKEAAALATLQELGFATVSELAPSSYRHAHTDDLVLVKARGESDWLDFVTGEVPKLKAAGWTKKGNPIFIEALGTSLGCSVFPHLLIHCWCK